MADQADIGVLGLAVMGANLARNAARHKFGVAVFNRNPERTDELIAQHGGEGRFFPAKALPEFIGSIKRPRPILIMVKAGKPVDEVIDADTVRSPVRLGGGRARSIATGEHFMSIERFWRVS